MASAQADANFSAPIILSPSVSFFRSTPRWPSATNDFALKYDYLTPVALTALIPVLVSFILIIFFLSLLILRYTCRQPKVDARILRMHHSSSATTLQILLSVIFSFLIFTFIAFGIVSVTAANFAFRDALDLIIAIVRDVSRTGFAFVDVGIFLENKLRAFSPSSIQQAPTSSQAPEQYIPALQSVQAYITNVYPDLAPLRDSLENVVNDIIDVLDVVRKAIGLASGVLVAICLLLLLAPLLFFLLDAMPLGKRSRIWRVFVHVLLIVFPSLLAYAMVGVTASVGAVLADVCVTVHDYRSVLFGDASAADFPNNALIKSVSTCPDNIDPQRLSEQFNGTIDSVLQSDFAVDSIDLLLDTPAKQIADTAAWTRDEVLRYVDCSKLIEFSGKLEFLACTDSAKSAVEATYDLFVAFLGMALVLTVALYLSLIGIRVAWALLVYPRENMEADSGLDDLSPQERRDISLKNDKELSVA